MRVVGLTGGIASGKSTVSSYLRLSRISIFDADASARQAVAQGSKCLHEIREAFGTGVLKADGTMDRNAMAQVVFRDAKARQLLEKIIVEGFVLPQAAKFVQEHKNEKIVVMDMPLLIECGYYKQVDEVWLVVLDEQTQIERACARDNMTEAEAIGRIKAQMPLLEKKKYADVLLDNTGSISELEQQVALAIERIVDYR